MSEPQVYLPHTQMKEGWLLGYIPKELVVRAAGDPTAVVPAIRAIVRRADPDLPIARVRTVDEILTADSAPRTVQVRVLATFAVLAILLAAVGLHGLLAFSVGQRTREIGVCMALGATRANIVRLVGGQGLALAAAGACAGLALGYGAARAMQAILFGISPADPLTFTVATAVVTLMALSGTLIPALRASRVDPTTAMRAD